MNNGIKNQPQLVSPISEPSTVCPPGASQLGPNVLGPHEGDAPTMEDGIPGDPGCGRPLPSIFPNFMAKKNGGDPNWVFLLKVIILGCEMGVPPF